MCVSNQSPYFEGTVIAAAHEHVVFAQEFQGSNNLSVSLQAGYQGSTLPLPDLDCLIEGGRGNQIRIQLLKWESDGYLDSPHKVFMTAHPPHDLHINHIDDQNLAFEITDCDLLIRHSRYSVHKVLIEDLNVT